MRLYGYRRTDGRTLSAVRRPTRPVDPSTLKKPELVKLAESKGIDSSGTKDEILERLS
jgi:hypothetical protein